MIDQSVTLVGDGIDKTIIALTAKDARFVMGEKFIRRQGLTFRVMSAIRITYPASR